MSINKISFSARYIRYTVICLYFECEHWFRCCCYWISSINDRVRCVNLLIDSFFCERFIKKDRFLSRSCTITQIYLYYLWVFKWRAVNDQISNIVMYLYETSSSLFHVHILANSLFNLTWRSVSLNRLDIISDQRSQHHKF